MNSESIDHHEKKMTREKVKDKDSAKEITSQEKELILFNDDVNTFDFVIETLIKVCEHDTLQAEQCALIAGNAVLKKGIWRI